VERAIQNSERSAHETLGLSDALVDISEELITNRVDTLARRRRLEHEIAGPLREIAEQRFARLLLRLEDLRRRAVADAGHPSQATATLAADCRRQCDEILVQMRIILGHMASIEDFNKLLDNFRELVRQQEELNRRTSKQQLEELGTPVRP
jgi:hypothetical protein